VTVTIVARTNEDGPVPDEQAYEGDGGGLGVVVAGGDPPAPDAAADLPDGAYVIAADSGLDHALALGLDVDVVVGDLDSVRPETLAAAVERGVTVVRYPEAKDATDLELALDLAAGRRPSRLVVVGGGGGRTDHLLAAALLLSAERYAAVPTLEARFGRARLTVIRPGHPATLTGEPGELVSLLPVHGPARGVTTGGLLYPLADEDLVAGTTRGVSNELAAPSGSVRVREGALVAVQPGERGTHLASRPRPEEPARDPRQ
jgi:thiamine pyrophosphokinase